MSLKSLIKINCVFYDFICFLLEQSACHFINKPPQNSEEMLSILWFGSLCDMLITHLRYTEQTQFGSEKETESKQGQARNRSRFAGLTGKAGGGCRLPLGA